MTEGKNYSRYLAKGSAIAFIAMVIAGISGLILRMFLTRALSVEDYGLFYAVFGLFSFLQNFRSLGFQQAVPKFISEFKAKEKFDSLKSSCAIAYIAQLGFVLPVTIILVIFSEPIATGFFSDKAAQPLIIIMGIWFMLLSVERVGGTILHGLKDMLGTNMIKALRIFPVFIFVLGLSFFLDIDTTIVALGYISAALVSGIWTLFRLNNKRSLFKKGTISLDKDLTKKLFLFGLPLIFSGVATTIMGWTDTLMITWFKTSVDVGLYQVAKPATKFIGYLGVISVPLLPMVSELWADKNKNTLKSTFRILLKLSILITIPVMLVFLSFPRVIIRVLFGGDYVGAALALQIMAVGTVLKVLSQPLGTGLIGAGKSKTYGKIMGAVAVANFVGNLILVPLFGIEGAALTTSLSFLILFLLRLKYLRNLIEFPSPWKDITKVAIGGLATLLIVFSLKTILPLSTWPKLFAVVIPGGLFYLLWIFRTEVVKNEDIDLLKTAIPIIPKWLESLLRKLTKS